MDLLTSANEQKKTRTMMWSLQKFCEWTDDTIPDLQCERGFDVPTTGSKLGCQQKGKSGGVRLEGPTILSRIAILQSTKILFF